MKFIKKITSAMIAGVLCISCAGIGNMELFKHSDTLLVADAAATIWDGTADTSWYDSEETEMHISTAEELAGLASIVNGGKNMEGQTVILDKDVYLSSTLTDEDKNSWISIGNKDNVFSGTFEGNNHTIYGLYDPSGGLFGSINGTIQNLSLKDAVVTEHSGLYYESSALCGINSGGTIENCTVDAEATANKKYYGGICGKNDGGTIIECVNSGSINVIDYDSEFTGGICGYNAGTVSFSESNADIVNEGNYYNCIGGIIGYADREGNVTNLHNKGNISILNTETNCGGVIGNANSDITNCVNDGNIDVNSGSSSLNCGGIAGKSNINIKFENCINNGDLTSTKGYIWFGGIVGNAYWYGSNELSDSDRELKFIKCGNNGNITSYNSSGGLAGHIDCYRNSEDFRNIYCAYSYNKGDIASKSSIAGGLFGYLFSDNITIESSYNLGNITASITSSANAFLGGSGGLIGMFDDRNTKLDLLLDIKNSFSAAETVSGDYPGGIAGYIPDLTNLSAESCYYLNSGAPQGVGSQNTDVGITKSAANMKKEAFAKSLGNAFVYNKDDYPILFWEAGIPMLSINKTKMTLNELNQQDTIIPDTSYDGELIWTSSNDKVATVDQNGVVTAVGNGTCTITLVAGGAKATCEVTVAYEYYLKETKLTMNPDFAVELKVYSKSNDEPTTLEVTYSSSNEDVAEVNKRGIISANAPGVAEIHAFIGGMDLVCVVNVKGVKGNVNADGEFNIVDVVALQKWLLAVPDAKLNNWKAGDLCEDDMLNVFDLCVMKKELVSK